MRSVDTMMRSLKSRMLATRSILSTCSMPPAGSYSVCATEAATLGKTAMLHLAECTASWLLFGHQQQKVEA